MLEEAPIALADLLTTIRAEPPQRPRDDELDLFGLTHVGNVRRENQDHFLLGTVHPQVVIHGTSLPEPDRLPVRGERLAVKAEAAARAEAASRAEARDMATTLTLAIAVWPWAYVLQVGDSRCYHYQDGVLRQVTRDQTMAQDLVDRGVLPAERAAVSPLSHVLVSAIGSDQAAPEVTRLDIRRRGCIVLLCSDGLTAHVSDAEIAERLRSMESSEQVCRSLLDLALERGGTDNITVLVGRATGASPA